MSSPTAVAALMNPHTTPLEFWIRVTQSDGSALRGAADCDTASIIYYLENPFGDDMLILEAIMYGTVAGTDGDIDIGLADDAAGSNSGVEICDSLVQAVGFKRLLVALDGISTAGALWKAKGTSADSFITFKQNADADASGFRGVLALRLMPSKVFTQ
jgi:hypothetical protein